MIFVVLFSFWSGVVLPVGFQLWKQIMLMNSVWRKEEIMGEHRVEARSWGRGGRNCRDRVAVREVINRSIWVQRACVACY